MTDLTGQVVGRYRVTERLGEGGMATVYKAYDTRLECDVALKIIRRTAFGQEMIDRILARFKREAQVLARLNHPNIVGIIDYGEMDGSPYLVMRYMPGGTLRSRTGRVFPAAEAAEILLPIARALDYAHRQQVLHRDVKPANILLTETGEPVLSDFGIARMLEGSDGSTLTGAGVGIGTPEYMAPEQSMGQPVDARADVYALGVVLYELVTGRKPFEGDTPVAVMVKHVSEPLPSPRKFIVGISEEVERVLNRALAKKPEDRFDSMAGFAAALQQIALTREVAKPLQTEQPGWLQALEQSDRSKKPEPAPVQKREPVVEMETVDVPAPVSAVPQARNKRLFLWIFAGLLVILGAVSGILLAPPLLASRDAGTSVPEQVAGAATSAPATSTRLPSPSAATATSAPAASPTAALTPTAAPSLTIPARARIPGQKISAENAASLELLHRKSFEENVLEAAFLTGTNELVVLLPDQPLFLDVDTLEPSGRTAVSKRNSCLAVSPDGKTLAIGRTDFKVFLLDLASEELQTIGQHNSFVMDVAFSPDGSVLVSTGRDSAAMLWDVKNQSRLAKITLRWYEWPVISFSQKDSLFAVADAGVFQLIHSETGEVVRSIWDPLNGIVTLAFSPDGSLLVTGGGKTNDEMKGLSVWNTSTWELSRRLNLKTAAVNTLAFSPDGSLLAVGMSDGKIRIYERTYFHQVVEVPAVSPNPGSMWIGFNESGDLLAASIGNQLMIWGIE